MQYKIITELDFKNLQTKVNKYITEGYKPLGGVEAMRIRGVGYFFQSMYKRKKIKTGAKECNLENTSKSA